jgi:undecaprenyl diphosphate synthase
MGLFMEALKKEVIKLHKNNVRFVMIGDRTRFNEAL